MNKNLARALKRLQIKSVFMSDVCVHVYLQERRKEFEGNLEKAGLELETEDKTVRNPETWKQRHLQLIHHRRRVVCRNGLKGMGPVMGNIHFPLSSGIQRPENLFPEDPRSLGRSSHVCGGLEDQGSLQGERHPPRSGCPSGVALAPAPPARTHHAPTAGLLHLPL